MSTDRKLSMAELDRCSVEEHQLRPKHPVVVLLEDIRSGHNVGSIFRTADALAVEKVVLCGKTSVPPHREIEKTALGATRTVPWQAFDKTEEAIVHLRNGNYRILAVEQTMQATPLQDLPMVSSPTVLVLGNEVRGVSQGLLEQCDGAVYVPQFGTKHSLNVAVCAGMVLWQVTRGVAPR